MSAPVKDFLHLVDELRKRGAVHIRFGDLEAHFLPTSPIEDTEDSTESVEVKTEARWRGKSPAELAYLGVD